MLRVCVVENARSRVSPRESSRGGLLAKLAKQNFEDLLRPLNSLNMQSQRPTGVVNDLEEPRSDGPGKAIQDCHRDQQACLTGTAPAL